MRVYDRAYFVHDYLIIQILYLYVWYNFNVIMTLIWKILKHIYSLYLCIKYIICIFIYVLSLHYILIYIYIYLYCYFIFVFIFILKIVIVNRTNIIQTYLRFIIIIIIIFMIEYIITIIILYIVIINNDMR